MTMAEASYRRREGKLIDRGGSPWDGEWRRPSHADKRKAIRRAILGNEIQAAVGHAAETGDFQAVAERLVELARGW